jgi:hypothetical protein
MQGGLWDRVDTSVGLTRATESSASTQQAPVRSNPWDRWRWWIVNAVASAFWLYAVCKVFIFDIDQALIQRILPQGGWLVTYRFLVLLAFASLAALVLQKWEFFFWLLYFAFFPLITLLWWIPRAIYKSRSWVALLAVTNIVTTFVTDFSYTLITKTAALIAIGLILLNISRSVELVAAITLFALLLITYVRTVALVMRPSRFVTGQQRVIDWIVGSDAIKVVWGLSDDLKAKGIVKFDSAQLTKFANAVVVAGAVHRAVLFWAYQLDSYRKGAAPYFFNLLSYLWLFVQTIVAYAFINLALYRADPHSYDYRVAPSLFEFVHYTINVILGGSITELEAHSQLAVALADTMRVSGFLVLITIIATLVLSQRQSRQDDQMKETISRIKARARQFDTEFQGQYEVPIDVAIERLRQAPGAFLRVVDWLSRQIPNDFQ